VKELAPSLRSKAERVLGYYGGLKGLAAEPARIVSYVLKAFFSQDEARQLLEYVGKWRGKGASDRLRFASWQESSQLRRLVDRVSRPAPPERRPSARRLSPHRQ
jgi:hypothetical protein